MLDDVTRGRPHDNSGLFSDHYLDVTLPESPGWSDLITEAGSVMDAVAGLLDSYTPSRNEAQTEEDLVKPVLRLLGHTFEVQPALSTPEGTKRPDYVFYRDHASLDANKDITLDEGLLSGRAFAVGDAKFWDRPLDSSLKSGSKGQKSFDNRNPSYQISFYMRHSGADWGILTNGKLWRLYHRDSAHRLDCFYEVDLPALVESGDARAFLYFYAFFRRAAFDEGSPLSAEAFLSGSIEYARSIEDSLRRQVYDALRHIAQGFLDYESNDLTTEPEDLREVYDAALILLYRILFVLYAEARDLLPVKENAAYRSEYSLYTMKRNIADSLDGGSVAPAGRARLYGQLSDLFDAIASGDRELGIPTYNGGLFDTAKHPFLKLRSVGTRHLQLALDKLARVDGRFVDYRDLSERHLGTIYEGLLEYHLEPADTTEGDGWTVALLDGEGSERHDTGSYYTPDFIVKHIVDRTVGPALEEAVADRDGDEERIAAVLELNVLDPAMGSGHFLVEVTEYIARFLVGIGVSDEETEVPDGEMPDSDAELARWKRRVVQSCVYGVDLNPLAVELAKLSLWLSTVSRDRPLSFLDHHLRCGNSLVGAEIPDPRPRGRGWNVKKAPRKRKNPGESEDQLSMLDDDAFRQSMSTAVGSIWKIEESPAESAAEVREQERLYVGLRSDLDTRYTRLANLATAASGFGVEPDPALWNAITQYATRNNAATLPQFERWMDEAEQVARQRRFFHWELEFPEVFFDREGAPLGESAGFDAVVGNPPYVRQEYLGTLKPYFKLKFEETYNGVADLYVYFYQLGLEKLAPGARLGYIVTNKWLRAGYGEPLRTYFAARGAVEEILDFGHAPIFADADVFPCIVTLRNKDNLPDSREEEQVLVTSFPREALGTTDLSDYSAENGHYVPGRRFTGAAWSLETSEVDDLMSKLRERGIPLAEFAGVRSVAGIKTGLNEAFLIDTPTKERLVREDGRSGEMIKPYLRGQDIKRWSPDWQNLWMIVLKSSGDFAWPWSNTSGDEAERIFRETYPAIHAHMKPLEARLRKRSDKGRNWWELRSCAYYNVFESSSIFYQDLAYHSRFGVGSPGTVPEMTCFALPSQDSWIQAVLNSPLMWTYMWRNVVHGKDEVLRLKTVYTEKLPIAPPTSESARDEAESAVGRLVGITSAEQRSVRDMLDWLRLEYGVEKPGQKLQALATLDSDTFLREVRKRLPREKGKSQARLTPATLRELRDAYEETAIPVKHARTEAADLERRISRLVNEAYGLSPEEAALMRSTAPPRTPPF